MTSLVNIKHKPTPKYDVYLGRANTWLDLPASKWANPFPMKKEEERHAVIAQYREYLFSNNELMIALEELKGKTLACYCTPKYCHGNVLIEYLEMYELLEQKVYPFSMSTDFLYDIYDSSNKTALKRIEDVIQISQESSFEVAEIFHTFDSSKVDLDVSIALLTKTLELKSKFPSRMMMFDRLFYSLKEEDRKILKGLK